MTVHVLIPVFNRLAMTRHVLECLRLQELDESLQLIVIDDGSTDGTAGFLESQYDVCVLKGDGSLWWGGAIELGLLKVLEQANPADWVLLINNDTKFAGNFVQQLLDAARAYAPAAIGSVIHDEAAPSRLLSIGPAVDLWRLKITDKLVNDSRLGQPESADSVDALSGRGTLYPLSAFLKAGTMKPAWLPHYWADYELAVRVQKAGFKLMVAKGAVVFSTDEFGNSYKPKNLMEKYFSVRSANYLPAVLAFWWRASSFLQRFTLLPRLLFTTLKSRLSSS
jgi:N-acetylglucosaminyl-diphospho-decaprenol L-rhamnosyltransferase